MLDNLTLLYTLNISGLAERNALLGLLINHIIILAPALQ